MATDAPNVNAQTVAHYRDDVDVDTRFLADVIEVDTRTFREAYWRMEQVAGNLLSVTLQDYLRDAMTAIETRLSGRDGIGEIDGD